MDSTFDDNDVVGHEHDPHQPFMLEMNSLFNSDFDMTQICENYNKLDDDGKK